MQEPGGRNHVFCPHCGYENRYPVPGQGPPAHHLYALEYTARAASPPTRGGSSRRPTPPIGSGSSKRKRPERLAPSVHPPGENPGGDETARLHRWGYERYDQLFNARQLLGLQTLASHIAAVEDRELRHALLTVFSDTLRYQNMLCRYDSYALKILDVFSVHGFPVSVTQCENALLGIPGVGSGGSGTLWTSTIVPRHTASAL